MGSKNVEEIALAARDEASRVIQNVASELGDVGNALTRLTALSSPAGIALAAIGLTVGGIVAVGAGVSDAVEQLDNLSAASGVSVENLQVFREQIKEAGKDPEGLTSALRFLNRSIATQDPILKELGITTKDTFTAFMQLSEAFGRSNDSAKKNEIAFQLLGRGAGELVGILPQIAAGFAGMKGAMESAGGVMSGSTLNAARALDQQMDTLGRNWTTVLTHIKTFTVPWANDIVQSFDDVWNALFHHGEDSMPEVDRKITNVQNEIREAMSRLQNAQRGHSASSSEFTLAQDEFDNDLKVLEARLTKLNDLKAKLDPAWRAAANTSRENVGGAATEDPLKKILVGDELQRAQEEAKKWAEKVKDAAGAAKMLGMTADEAARAFDRLEKNKKAGEIFAAIRASMQPAGPPVPEELYKLNLALDQTAAMLGKPRVEAVALADSLMHLKRTAAEGFPISTAEQQAAVEALNKKISETAALLDRSTAESAHFVEALAQREKRDAAIDLRKKLGIGTASDGIVKLQEKYKELVDSSALVQSAFTTAFDGMTAGAEQFFSQLNGDTHIASTLLVDIWHQTANAIIKELIRIEAVKAAFKIASFFLPVPGTAIAPGIDLGSLPVPGAPPALPIVAPVSPTSLRSTPTAAVKPPSALTTPPVAARPLPAPTAAKAPAPEPFRLVIPSLPKFDQKVALSVPPFADVHLVHDLDQVFARGVANLAGAIPDTLRVATLLPDVSRLVDLRLALPAAAPERQAKPAAAPGGGQDMAPAAGDTWNVAVHSYDLRDGVRELQSMAGGQRRAQTKLTYLREA